MPLVHPGRFGKSNRLRPLKPSLAHTLPRKIEKASRRLSPRGRNLVTTKFGLRILSTPGGELFFHSAIMLNLVWVALLLAGVICAAFTGRFDALNQGALNAARSAVMEIALPLVGAMALWLGMMRLAERAGLIQLLGRVIRPIMSRLFPEIPANHPAMGAMMMSIAANMLGVSNA